MCVNRSSEERVTTWHSGTLGYLGFVFRCLVLTLAFQLGGSRWFGGGSIKFPARHIDDMAFIIFLSSRFSMSPLCLNAVKPCRRMTTTRCRRATCESQMGTYVCLFFVCVCKFTARKTHAFTRHRIRRQFYRRCHFQNLFIHLSSRALSSSLSSSLATMVANERLPPPSIKHLHRSSRMLNEMLK